MLADRVLAPRGRVSAGVPANPLERRPQRRLLGGAGAEQVGQCGHDRGRRVRRLRPGDQRGDDGLRASDHARVHRRRDGRPGRLQAGLRLPEPADHVRVVQQPRVGAPGPRTATLADVLRGVFEDGGHAPEPGGGLQQRARAEDLLVGPAGERGDRFDTVEAELCPAPIEAGGGGVDQEGSPRSILVVRDEDVGVAALGLAHVQATGVEPTAEHERMGLRTAGMRERHRPGLDAQLQQRRRHGQTVRPLGVLLGLGRQCRPVDDPDLR